MAVPELGKARNERCELLRRSALGHRCGVYNDRPQACRAFQCLWLQGAVPKSLKPDEVRAVLDCNARGDIIVAHIQPADRGAHRRGALGEWITAKAKAGLSILVACGDERHAFGPVARQIERGEIEINAHDAPKGIR